MPEIGDREVFLLYCQHADSSEQAAKISFRGIVWIQLLHEQRRILVDSLVDARSRAWQSDGHLT